MCTIDIFQFFMSYYTLELLSTYGLNISRITLLIGWPASHPLFSVFLSRSTQCVKKLLHYFIFAITLSN